MQKSPMGSSNNFDNKKKKAADFYFAKKTSEIKTLPQKNDFMTGEVVAPSQAPSKVSPSR
jgi:hypothetical protein